MSIRAIEQLKVSDPPFTCTARQMSEKAYLAADLFLQLNRNMVAVFADPKQAIRFKEELEFFLPGHESAILFFPGYNILPFKSMAYHKDTAASRVAVLSRVLDQSDEKLFIITCVQPLMQKIVPRKQLMESMELVIDNEEIDREGLVQNLEASGYTRTTLVEDPGEYSVRGSILDVFSPGAPHPVRLDFFGDLVESLRYFSPVTQRGVKPIEETVIIPASEVIMPKPFMPHILSRLRQTGYEAGLDSKKTQEYIQTVREQGRFPGIESMLSIVYETLDTLFDYIPNDAFLMLDDPDFIESNAKDFERNAMANYDTAQEEERLCVKPDSILNQWDNVKTRLEERKGLVFNPVPISSQDESQSRVIEINSQDNSLLSDALKRQAHSDQVLKPLVEWYQDKIDQQMTVISVLSQDIQAKRLLSLLKPYGIEPVFIDDFARAREKGSGIYYTMGNLSSGFVIEEERLALVSEKDIFQVGKLKRRSRAPRDAKAQFITPEELKNGDIVVHVQHGIGRYEGLTTLTINGMAQDFILLVYQDDDKLYLPVDRMEMIGKYVGVEGYTPILDKIGSKSWVKSKAKAKEEVEKLAADLLDLYARRKANKGFAFSAPDNYFREFETTFSYTETRDQLRAIDDVLADMSTDLPMDRLVCGDVGYGKTEVAIRAAFKAVCDGKQVAIVVPTTILAEQHAATFRERFDSYPVTIECLSRFRSRKEQTQIVKQMTEGRVDIVIGTHRLLQKDIEFSSLGLLIIDEEQRFGVKHKEKLKQKRNAVDVLALTATPIPRTLHMSLTGMRDISVISTPPEDRQAIVSYITRFEDGIVKDAVRKEMARKGQVFFVHNNIKTISRVKENLSKLIPEAKVDIAHGRLSEAELEKVMVKFISGELDVLVCTTIIESGLDIPSANTMIINKAERFGLSQIYQLRGRIGRGDYQAYAYLFVSDESLLTKDAKKRLSALMEYRDLGSGFQIAMKDLQIRGAGSALGASQSGHIAAVGYDMFLKLLDHAVKDMKGEDAVEALDPEINAAMSCFFPKDYIESVEQRLTIYRRLSRVSELSQISDLQKELADRFGKLPKEAENMLLKIMLRVYAIKAGIKRLDISPNTLTLSFSDVHRSTLSPYGQVLDAARIRHQQVSRDTVKILLGEKRSKISRALLEAKQVLKQLCA
ncbi:MAG: transcription-repair coupling factor [Desulfobacteraceae bacterium]|nr:MAG: transcription-repair coupling factor [Desulfobacteraceae bacterium]